MSKDPASVASLGELATLTETPYWYLRSIVERRTDPYMSLQRAKRGGCPYVVCQAAWASSGVS